LVTSPTTSHTVMHSTICTSNADCKICFGGDLCQETGVEISFRVLHLVQYIPAPKAVCLLIVIRAADSLLWLLIGDANTQRKKRQVSKCNVQTPIEITHSGSLLFLDRRHILEVLPIARHGRVTRCAATDIPALQLPHRVDRAF